MFVRACYICGGDKTKTVLKQDFEDYYLSLISKELNQIERRIVICDKCGFIYHSPTLSHEEIHKLYLRFRDTSFRKETPDEYFDRITALPKDQSFNYKKTLLLNDLVRIFLPKKKIRTFYDVGTGGGVFVKTFLDHAVGSWTAYGVEPTESYAELAARRLNIPVIQGFYRPGLHSVKFDLITANKVLEHAEDSIEFLKGFHRDLALDGMVYIEVPNAKEIFTLPPDHDQLLYEHLFFYSANVFEYICAQADFEVVWKDEPQNAEGEVDLIVVLKKKLSSSKKKDFSFPLSRLKDLIPATVQT